ncbi:zinc-binding oxidoreductase ToxD [Penicillium desertorum]|uniref:Zinc-binding oxidoreductase ToxD n=1 Tax=Penicillium desertorum TaxID=1303715 RepID=A0A9W9WNX0_9EURO|nr:zinc-binding oxidoreductase ToxD [Penicillium desertorum]
MLLTQPGDSVTGLFYEDRPGDPTSDTFGKYALQKTSLSMPVRDSVSHTEAATLPVRVKSIHILLNSTVEDGGKFVVAEVTSGHLLAK